MITGAGLIFGRVKTAVYGWELIREQNILIALFSIERDLGWY